MSIYPDITEQWAKEHELLGQDVIWYEQHWDRGMTFENDRAKLVWHFEFHLRNSSAIVVKKWSNIRQIATDTK